MRKDWKGSGLARQTGSFIDPTLNWDDISWLRQLTNLPIVVKGIQRWEDAKLAMKSGCQGIVLSNHGGRAADGAPPTIVLLLELHRNCPEVFQALDILIDGGFRRGSDVVKAICLGASAVGLGRPFVYAVNYGQGGVSHAVNSEITPSNNQEDPQMLTYTISPARRNRDGHAPLWDDGFDEECPSRLCQYS